MSRTSFAALLVTTLSFSIAVSIALPLAAPSFAIAAEPVGGYRWTPETIVDMTQIDSVEMSPDGRRVVYVATRPRAAASVPDAALGPAWSNLYLVSVDSAPASGKAARGKAARSAEAATPGAARRLTSADAEDKSPAWSPDSRTIAFLSARGSGGAGGAGGDKAKTRIWLVPADGGEPAALTKDTIDVESFAWGPDGRRIAYVAIDPKSEAKEKDEKAGRDWKVADQDERPRRLWTIDVATKTEKKVAALGERSVWQFAWAPGGAEIVAAVTATPRTDDSYMGKRLLVLPLGPQGAARELAGIVGKVAQLYWSLDGRTIAWRGGVDGSDPSSGSIFIAPATGGRAVNLTGERQESAQQIVWMSGTTLVAAVSQGTRATLVSTDTGDPSVRYPILSPGTLGFEEVSAAKDGTRFAFEASTGAVPAEVYMVQGTGREAQASVPRRLTDLNPQLAALPRGNQETFRYNASDGTALEGLLLHPVGDATRASYALVVIVHGGPEYHFSEEWTTRYSEPAQALAERGYYVFFPNYRGSTGRGVDFAKGDHHDLGGREFQDVLDGIAALATPYRINLKQVGMTGGSYGGYFTALAATRYSSHFAAGVFLFGISDWFSFLGQSDIPVENSAVHWDLWCWDHQEVCRNASPVAHINEAATPLLILQGEADARVPKPQSDELYAALKWKGVPAEYVLFPREKHGFAERAHRIETCTRLLGWFERYLKP